MFRLKMKVIYPQVAVAVMSINVLSTKSKSHALMATVSILVQFAVSKINVLFC